MAGNKSAGSNQIISLPKGGGALQGIGEKFSPDLFTGTGNFTVPITMPPGRNGFQPQLNLTYSTGSGNGPFGLGWQLSIPNVTRKTSKGTPKYNDNSLHSKDWDTFILSGSEDLVPVALLKYTEVGNTIKLQKIDNPIEQDFAIAPVIEFRPRTEGLFARIYRHRFDNNDYWEVRSKDGTVNFYGLPDRTNTMPSTIADPDKTSEIFSWRLSKTVDSFGNVIEYIYEKDTKNTDGPHHWDQIYLSEIRYVDYDDHSGGSKFLIAVKFLYEDRPDKFSDYRSGFEIRTTKRCTKIETHLYPNGQDILIRTLNLVYLDIRMQTGITTTRQDLPINGASLLTQMRLQGHDGQNTEWLPPLEFNYSEFKPKERKFLPITGENVPPSSLSNQAFEMVDVNGDGLPDIIELNNIVARYWLNLGNGTFDRPKEMKEAPLGIRLSDPGVQLVDANGDGRMDLLVTSDDGLSGYFSIGKNADPKTITAGDNKQLFAQFDPRSFHRYNIAPSFNLKDPEVRLIDLDGDGVIDALRSGITSFELFFNEPEKGGWIATRSVEKKQKLDEFPNITFSDQRIRLADMTGDGLQDIVMIFDGNVSYWPYLGHGKWSKRVIMSNCPRLEFEYDPRRILLGDVDGDGLADIVYVDDKKVSLWINKSGNSWSDPLVIEGTPLVSDTDSVRLVDMLGMGVSGVLWTSDRNGLMKHNIFFLEFTGGVKPYLLNEMNNNMGAITKVGYSSSTKFFIEDQKKIETRWKTSLPFPVLVVDRVEVIDEISKGKLTTQYVYHNGYWDGAEREFRGFGRVDHRDTEFFEGYSINGLHSPDKEFEQIPKHFFSPPTETRTWFHQGPIGEEYGAWYESDYSKEYWSGDPNILDAARPKQMIEFVNLLKAEKRRIKRDALRTLRGRILRTELYALDDTPRRSRPYIVTEYLHGVLPVPLEQPFTQQQMEDLDQYSESNVSHQLDTWRYHVLFPCSIAERTSQWERGNEPMTLFRFTGKYNQYGLACSQITVAVPRGRDFRVMSSSSVPYLVSEDKVTYAHRDDNQKYIVDRVAGTTGFEILNDGTDSIFDLRKSIEEGVIMDSSKKVISQTVNHYDGARFQGLPYKGIGDYGALVRTETLLLNDDIIGGAYDSSNSMLYSESYLSHEEPIWDAEYPVPFQSTLPFANGASDLTRPNLEITPSGYGYSSGNMGYQKGYYSAVLRLSYDFHDNPASSKGLVKVRRDPVGHDVTVEYDVYKLFPTKSTDAGLTVEARYDYHALQVNEVIDQNRNQTKYTFSPLGLLESVKVSGKQGADEGDNVRASKQLKYELNAFRDSNGMQPINIRTIQYVYHDTENISEEDLNEKIESVGYSDGFGRVIQTRTQAERTVFGDSIFGDIGLMADQSLPVGDATGSTTLDPDNPRVVVTGLQVFDNKGRIVEKYEPYFSQGWNYEPPALHELNQKITIYHDSVGRDMLIISPDGSEQRIVYGIPIALDNPENFLPSPWEKFVYDANDNARRTHLSTSLGYSDHWNTPISMVVDGLGRTIETVERNGSLPADWLITHSTFDIKGNILQVIDAQGRVTCRYVYDLSNRALRIEVLDAGIRRVFIDPAGKTLEQRDSKGTIVLRGFDEIGRPASLWARDQRNEPISMRERFVYGDDFTESGLSQAQALSRNLLGKLFKHYDEAGLLSILEYDFKGNPLEKERRVISDSTILTVFNSISNNWQVSPYRINWFQPNGLTLEAYADLILESNVFKTSVSYDALGRIISIIYPKDVNGSRKQMRTFYNQAGGVEKVELDGIMYVQRIAYNARGQRCLVVYGNGTMTRYAYDGRTFRLSRIRTEQFSTPGPLALRPTGKVYQDSVYNYDLVGNILSILERVPGSGIAGTALGTDQLDRNFIYYPIYRLRQATGREHRYDFSQISLPWNGGMRVVDPTAARLYTQEYQYDKVGNMTDLHHYATGGGLHRIYAVNNDFNRLTSLTIGPTSYSYIYDENGNLVKEGSARHFGWDHNDRLSVHFVQPGNSEPSVYVHYLYDSSGQRIKKITRKQGGHHFEVTINIDGVFEYHRKLSGSTVMENNTVHVVDNKRRIALVRIGNTIPPDSTPAVTYHIGDHLDNSNVLIDESGTLINREEFTPFGETSFGGATNKRYRFAGKECDEESSTYYFGARYYAPWLTRWMSCDPGGFVDGINLYSYARNNPIKLTDPNGTDTTEGPVRDVVVNISQIQKPGDVGQWWNDKVKPNKADWSGPLSPLEQQYLEYFTGPNAPSNRQIGQGVADPNNLSSEETAKARKLFGSGENALKQYANYENRRRIIAHYAYTHPATINLMMGTYRLARDLNPIHFALERGWQVGGGQEMFTGKPVSRFESGLEFVGALALGVAVNKTLGGIKSSITNPSGGVATMKAINSSDLSLKPISGDRIWLGQYGGEGMIINGVRVNVPKPGLQWLEGQAQKFGGKTLQDLPGNMKDIGPRIAAADEIVFNLTPGITAQSLTGQELIFILSNPSIMARTTFVVGSPLF